MKLQNNLILILIYICFLCCIYGCSQSKPNNKKTSNDNPLLADKVKAGYPVEPNHILNEPGIGKYDLESFVKKLFNKVYDNKIHVNNYDGDIFSVEEVNTRLGNTDNLEFSPHNLKEITHLGFKEEWDFEKDKLIFNKTLIKYFPVREWSKNENSAKYKRKIFLLTNQSKSEFDNLLAKDIIYQYPLYEPPSTLGLDIGKFCEYLTQNVINGKIKAYDPTFLVSLEKRELPKQEIENISKIKSVCEEAKILIFHEDWFYDSNTMSIQKKVKGIALGGHFNIDGKYEKKTLFYIPLNY